MRRGPTATVSDVERLTAWERLRRVNPYAWDALVAVGVFAFIVLNEVWFYRPPGRGVDESLGWALIVLACAPLGWRRRAPITTFALIAIATVAYGAQGFPGDFIGLAFVIALYTAAAHRSRGPVLAAVLPIALVATVMLAILTAGQEGSPIASLDSSEGLRNVMSAASSGAVVVLVIGILVMAGEFRHNTATSTFLISPDRKRVVGAKLAAASLVGVGVAAAASLLTLAIALPWLRAKHVEVSLGGDVGLILLGALAASALYAMVGIGVGALLRNQTVAVTVALVWVMIVEGILVGLAPEIGRWLPSGAAGALTASPTGEGGLLPMWGGALLLAGYRLAFAAAGTRFVLRRDIG